ncbi:MAG: mechanosensitive ion channel domain-containing protein [Saprospiraceae bacterium]|jgi:hypothetical protein|nr:mechanosensitive ion channel [Saprospiraceae bacterium]MBK7467385.1 mechanosensitive ion channel [Saprospiraceae bacterium]MBK9995036.1 mechanosensitive ion channel [Saprospiraceae bacterium]
MQIAENVRHLLLGFLDFIPKLVGAIILLIIGYIVSNMVKKFICKLFEKFGIDKMADKINESDMLAKSNFKVIPSLIISSIVYYFIFLIFIVAATDALGMEALSQLIKDIINWVPNLITALVLLFVGFLFADFIKDATLKATKSFGIPSGGFIANAVFYFVLINVLISALGQAKVNTSFIATNISILIGGVALAFAIGYGFASKDMVANFLVSFYSKDKLNIGQKVTLDGVTGTIIDIDKTSITLECDNKEVIIPLNKLAKERIEIYNS